MKRFILLLVILSGATVSLHDVDKGSLDRGAPTPNASDVLLDGAVKSHKTISTHYTTDADTNSGRLQMSNKQIIGNDGTTPITLYGYNQALNKWGFFVTQPGTDVTTNTDLSKFIFNSTQDIFKIAGTNTATVPDTPAQVAGSVSIGGLAIDTGIIAVSGVSIGQVYMNSSGNYFSLPSIQESGVAPTGGSIVLIVSYFTFTGYNGNIWITVNVRNYQNSVWPAFSVRWYVLQETAS